MAEIMDPTAGTGESQPDQSNGITRRELLANMLVAAVFLGTGAGIVNAVIRFLIPPKQTVEGTSEKIEVGAVAELTEGTSKYFAYNGIPCAAINVGGEIKAFSRVCTHLQCAIDWENNSNTFVCPCHAAVFDSNGKVVSGPAPAPIPELKVIIENGKVFAGGWA